jgi:hypothetical protein
MGARSPSPVYLVASGDLRLSANRLCWPAQKNMEAGLVQASVRWVENSFARIPTIHRGNTVFSITNAMGWRFSRRFPKMLPCSWQRQCGSTRIAYWPVSPITVGRF